MRIDKPGQHRHLAEVDDSGVRGLALDLGQRADGPNPFAFDQNSYIGLHGGGPAIDQASRFDECLGRGRLGRESGEHSETSKQQH
jgi:hypothetical protein